MRLVYKEHMTENVSFPLFEFVGPPCEHPECNGVLVDHIDLKTKEFFHKCSVCNHEFNRMPLADKLGYAVRIIKRTLTGMKED